MSDAGLGGAEGNTELEEAELERTRMGGKRLLLFIILPLFLLGAAGGGLYFSGMLDSLLGAAPAEDGAEVAEAEGEEGEAGPSAHFYDMEDILVNLQTPGRSTQFLKLSVTIELEREEDIALIEELMPRVRDQFQVYLRELRVEDLQGSAGIHRLREELLDRVSQAATPARVRGVLFREMLIQGAS